MYSKYGNGEEGTLPNGEHPEYVPLFLMSDFEDTPTVTAEPKPEEDGWPLTAN